MVQTTSHIFSGKVDIESNLLVGSSHLFVDTVNNRVGITTADPDASLHVNGNAYVESNVGVGSNIVLDGDTGIITAAEFRGDGSNLVGVLTSLQNATDQGSTSNATIQLTNADTSLVASGNVVVSGNVTSLTFIGDGSQLTGISTTLQAITDNGNVTSNTVRFTNTGTSLTASGTIEAAGVQVNGLDVALDQDMASNAARIGVLETDLTSNAARVSNLEAANVIQESLINNLRTDLDSNAVRVSSLETDRTSNTIRISILESANIIQESLINNLRTDLTSNTGRIADLEAANVVQESLINDLRTDVTSNTGRIAVLETDLTDNASRITVLEAANTVQETLINNLRTDVTSNTGRIAVLETDLTDNVSRIETLEVANTIQASLISTLESANTIQAGLITNLTTDLSSNAGRITDLETANGVQATLITNLTTDLSSNHSRITALESSTGGGTLTLQGITDLGNTTTNVVRFTNATTGLVTTANVEVGGDVKISGLTANKIPVVGANKFLEDSLIGRSNGKIVISSDLEVSGNIVVDGNSYIIESNSLVINDRILGISNNNTSHELDVGIIMGHPGKNVALIHHGESQGDQDPHDHTFTIGYTQNNVIDNHIFDDSNIITVEILGNLITQNNLTVGSGGSYYGDGTTLTGVALQTDMASNSYRIGTIETELAYPTFSTLTLDGIANRGNTTSNTILLTNATTGIVATGNVEALKFIGDGTSLTGLTLQHITDLGNVTTSNIQAAYFKGDGSELENITLDNVVNKGNATSNVIHLSNATKGLEADGNIHASFFIGDGSELTNVTLDNVVNKGNTTSNTVQFTNTGTSLTASGNVAIDGNVSSTTTLVSNVATMGTTKTFVVTVSGGYFHIDRVDRPALELHEHQTYIFDVSSLSGSQHVFRLSTTAQGTHGGGIEYTDGVDHSVANKLILTVQTGAPDLYYYCATSGHSSMGNTSPCKVYSTAELVVSGRVDVSGNVDVDSNINVLGNVYANSFVGNGAGLTNVPTVSTLQDVTTNGPSTSQAIQLTNTGTSLTASGGVTAAYFTGDGSNVNIGEMTAETIPYVDANKQLRDSHITRTADTTVITSNLQVEGNLFVTGETYAVNSENMVINDRIIGLANNNTSTTLDIGLMLQYPQKNVAMIHHGTVSGPGEPHNGQLTLGYTQSGFDVDNITKDPSNNLTLNVWGHVVTQNNITVGAQGSYYGDGTTLTGVALSADLTDNVTRIEDLETATIISNSSTITTGFTKGDIIYASADNVLNKLAIGTTDGYVLKITSAATKTLGWAAETGSGSTVWQTNGNDIYYSAGDVGINTSTPAFDLDVHGTANVGALTATSLSVGGQTLALASDLSANASRLDAIYTGSIGDIIYVDAANSLAKLGIGSSGQVLKVSAGGLPIWANESGGGGGGGTSQWTTVNTNEIYYDGPVGIANTDPGHDLSVGSNLYVDDDGSNVLVVTGNTAMSALTLGEVSIVASYNLEQITNTGNVTSNTVQFSNAITSLTAASNVVVTGNVTAGYFIGDGSNLTGISTTLQAITDNGNVTSNTIQFSNAITSLTAASNVVVGGNVTADYFVGDGSNLTGISSTLQAITDSGNVTSNTIQFSNAITGLVTTANIEVGGLITSTTKSASGGTESMVGSDKLHQFTTAGMFSVTGADISVEFLIIGGGGGGGRNHAGGGGGGQFVSGTITLPRGVYPIMVGRGGRGGYQTGSSENPGQCGGESRAFGFIARGGGGGGTRNGYIGGRAKGYEGLDGGCGGGGAGTAPDYATTWTTGGYGADSLGIMLGTTQASNNTWGGYGGGRGMSTADGTNAGHGGGGGGAGGSGGDASGGQNSGSSGAGGVGLASSITGTSVTYAGGGSGGIWGSATAGTTNGGGGAGSANDGSHGTNGLGGGGGGGGDGNGNGGNGGDGIVILRWTP